MIGVGAPTAVEQEIERARVGGEIAPQQPPRLEPYPPGPFQPDVLTSIAAHGSGFPTGS